MTFKKVVRRDKMAGSDKAFISIRPSRIFSFNSEFAKKADLGSKYNRVSIYTDSENWKVAFKFHNDKDDVDSFKLYKDGGSKSPARGMNTTAHSVFKHNRWIEKVAKAEDTLLRRFEPERGSSKKWVIQLAPSFEKEAKEVTGIPSNTTGIYRYIRKGEIVYIGKGNIRKRVNSPIRKGWEFDKIEYSIIGHPEIMDFWESFWIDKFLERNGHLPLYNKLSGQKKSKKQLS